MFTEKALAANRWFLDLALKHKVVPPSAPTDAFRQIVDSFKAGRTAMAIHHIGSAAEIVEALGDKVSAVPVPRAPDGGAWTYLATSRTPFSRRARTKRQPSVGSASCPTPRTMSSRQSSAVSFPSRSRVARIGRSIRSVSSTPALRLCRSQDRCLTTSRPRTSSVASYRPTCSALTGGLNPDDLMKAVEQNFRLSKHRDRAGRQTLRCSSQGPIQ